MKHQHSIRIIGGKWRSRKVSFANCAEIRPTSDRVRETLFNWLMHHVNGARCLDLFSGSGILGIEALSRGASRLTFIEEHEEIAAHLELNLAELKANHFDILITDAAAYLEATDQVFDIIFLDPPFDEDHLLQAITIIAKRKLSSRFVYIESERVSAFELLPDKWRIYRQKRAGRVNYGLITMP